MRKIRECSAPDTPEREDKPKPSTLHIDADEDHITLRGGKKAIVPLVSVYEGIEKRGKRGICRNVFHIARYGEKTEELWEEVLTEMEKRYDLSETKLSLHGDGANWIRSGLKFLPHCVFVLDPYHRKKALRQAVGGKRSTKSWKTEKKSVLSPLWKLCARHRPPKAQKKPESISTINLTRFIFVSSTRKPAMAARRNRISVTSFPRVFPPVRGRGAKRPSGILSPFSPPVDSF